ncbi:MAG: peptide deformylase [Candidatus Poribacteria bacterium]|nr:peptide deformylase [Candidatus Poribacteria bacterium]
MSKPKRKRKNRQSEDIDEIPRLAKTEPLQLRYYGDPVLRKRAEPVQEITEAEVKLADDMLMTLYATGNGIGLAATQVGVLKRFLIVDIGDTEEEKFEPLLLFNPEILSVEGESIAEEGCLSIPDVQADVKRPEKIVVKAMNLKGEEIGIETDGLIARVLQHEIDHLNGTLFIDRISGLKRQLLRSELKIIQQSEHPK